MSALASPPIMHSRPLRRSREGNDTGKTTTLRVLPPATAPAATKRKQRQSLRGKSPHRSNCGDQSTLPSPALLKRVAWRYINDLRVLGPARELIERAARIILA